MKRDVDVIQRANILASLLVGHFDATAITSEGDNLWTQLYIALQSVKDDTFNHLETSVQSGITNAIDDARDRKGIRTISEAAEAFKEAQTKP